MDNFSLHIITHPEAFDGEIDAIVKLMQTNRVYLHVRKPAMAERAYEAFIERLPASLYERVFLHAAYHLADKFDVAGIHLSTPKRILANGVGDKFNISTSCHSFEEINSLSLVFKQCFLSPVFDSISKSNYTASFDAKELCEFLKIEREIKVIALGGICADNISTVRAMGFEGAAVLGAIWGKHPKADDDFQGRLQTILNYDD